jgi:hypothetical protein
MTTEETSLKEITNEEGKKVVHVERNEKYEDYQRRRKAAVKKYYEKHKSEKYTCPICLGSVSFSNKYHHNNSNKHQKWLKRLDEEKRAKESEEQESSKNNNGTN